ncbi:MAG TPA: hypothetical protein VMC86_01770 [Gemmatimonadales bacterium]|nr:hypothetical protein [Gemmatimonadales bacterium]
MAELVGWLATAVFVSSYLFRTPATLRRVQGAGAVVWMTYGALIHSTPVIVANIFVAGAAIWSSFVPPRPNATAT